MEARPRREASAPRADAGALTRRRFLQLALAGAATAATGSAGCDLGQRLPDYPFTLGIASGDPLADRVVLWTRLALDPLAPGGTGGMLPQPYLVAWEVAHDAGFQRLVRTGVTVADPAFAHSVHVDVAGLAPNRWYYYRFHAGGYASEVGRTRTFPSPTFEPAFLRFASASCQNYKDGYYTAYAAMAQEDLDFVAFLGDYIYESGVDGAVRQHDAGRIQDLAGYRNRYALYKGDANLQNAHRCFPWIATWDDHEVANNYAGLVPDEDAPPDAVPPEQFPALRAAAYRAWWEHMPVRLAPPEGDSLAIHRSFAFGDLASVFVLDTRQYRTNQECGDGLGARCEGFPSPVGDMLGPAQEAWLTAGIAASAARWNVLAQQVVLSPTPIGQQINFDQWDGYPAARERLVDFLRARPIRDAVVLTGDIHASGAGWVPGVAPGAPDTFSDPVASEFVATGISSGGLDAGTASLVKLLFEGYPHVDYFDAVSRGYALHAVTRSAWIVDFRLVDTVLEPTSPVRTGASFVVARGNPAPAPF